jgi:hypothetical protein
MSLARWLNFYGPMVFPRLAKAARHGAPAEESQAWVNSVWVAQRFTAAIQAPRDSAGFSLCGASSSISPGQAELNR